MTSEKLRVLIVDDDREDAELVQDLLEDSDLWRVDVDWVASWEDGVEAVAKNLHDVCLLDHHLGARTGIDFLRDPVVRACDVPIILLTGLGTSEIDRQAWTEGAADYLPKSALTADTLERSIRYAIERRRRRRAERRFETLVATGRELISVVDEQGTLLYVSPSIRTMLGFEPQEKTGASSPLEVHPEDRDRVDHLIEALIEDPGHAHALQYRVRHADGSWRVFDSLAQNRLADPSVRGIVVSSRDVTEREEQERHIRMQAELLKAVGQAVVATDMDGRVIYWNDAAERIYGWSESEALGRDIVELTAPEPARGQAQDIMGALRRGESWTGEFLVRRADDTVIPALVTNSPILDEGGRRIGIIGVSSDISDLKRTETNLRERVKELGTLNRATRVLDRRDLALSERLQRFVDTIPAGWLHPEVTEARLVLPEVTVQTRFFHESSLNLSADVRAGNQVLGTLDVVLTEDRPEQDLGPFLQEEADLLVTLARNLGESLERERVTRHLNQVIENLEEGIFVIAPGETGRVIQSANPAAEKIFGYSADEMMGRTTEFLHVSAELFQRFGEEGDPALLRDGVFHADYPMRRKDGTEFPATQTVSLLNPDRGMEGGAVSVVRDMSEARAAQRELEASERRFRQFAEHIDDVFWISTPDKQHMEYVSPAYLEVWGRDPAELMDRGLAWLDSVHPDDVPQVHRFLNRQPTGDAELLYRIVRPDGDIRWIHDRAFPVRGPSGELLRVVGIAEDVTPRVAAEERLALLTREISDVIYIIDLEGLVQFTTPSIERAAGYSREEFEGMDVFELVHPDDREQIRHLMTEFAKSEDHSARAEYRFIRRDGSVRHVESVAQKLTDHPGMAGILITSRDVTERVELEQVLRTSQRLEAVGRLAGGIAHDFNNLLTIIRSQASLVLLDLDEADPTVEEIEVIQTAADRAARLTSQLLAFSREQVLRPRVVDLCEVTGEMVELISRVIGDRIELAIDLPGGLPSVEIDPGQLEQVVLNLAINARDAMPEGGTLSIRTYRAVVDRSEMMVSGMEASIRTVLEVSDTGQGMDEATINRIFEPFFTTKSETGGTGLGLAMTYGFVKQSGGEIDVTSAPGGGTTFTLSFPAAGEEPQPPPPPSMDADELADMTGRILLIEDNDAVRRVATRVLERAGLTVVEAIDAESGLTALDEPDAFDAVLTDLGLPGIGGRELVERLSQAHPGLPVIVMSGYAADSPGNQRDLPRDIPFVPKPFTPDELVRTVRQALLRE